MRSKFKGVLRLALSAIALTLAVFSGGPAAAQQRIGAASVVENEVSAQRSAGAVKLGRGDAVYRNEAVSTGRSSTARLTFLDDTNLSMGPASQVVLNEFVYRGGSQAQNVSMNLARGAFRFATGNSDKGAYQIKTSTATIGVRGTVLDILSGQTQTLITLMDDGAATICTANGANCQTLNVRGQTFVVDPSGVRPSNSPRTRFTFQQFCSGGAGLCGRTRLAQQPGDGPPGPQGPPIIDASLRRDELRAGCAVGGCLPKDATTQAGTWTGLATTIASSGPYSFHAGSFGLQLTSVTPVTHGSTVTGTVNDGGDLGTAAGNITATAVVDAGFQYTAWGEWNGSITVSNGEGGTYTANRGFAVFGSLTPSATVAGKTGSASYSGPVLADFVPEGSTTPNGVVGGTINMTANFSNQTVTGNLALTRNSQPWANPVFNNLPINLNSIAGGVGAGFEGALNATGAGNSFGYINGGFLGPNAQETAGYFTFGRFTGGPGDGFAHGIFRARQGGAL